MWAEIFAIIGGLGVLVWSADRFVEGAALTAKHFDVSPLLIGMLVVGFGTSAPEIVVSVISSLEGNPSLAIGNAYGSNITNIALILGVTALLHPIIVKSTILKKELPLLLGVTILSLLLIWDLEISRIDGIILLIAFVALLVWTIFTEKKQKKDSLEMEFEQEFQNVSMPLSKSIMWLILGLILLIVSSRALVWGGVEVAKYLGVSDLIIGLTVIAVGTSLPELASSIAASRKGEHDIALGNVIGSNLFNTLTVVGLAGVIKPLKIEQAVVNRDMLLMFLLTISLFAFGQRIKGQGTINRFGGSLLLLCYITYSSYLFYLTMH